MWHTLSNVKTSGAFCWSHRKPSDWSCVCLWLCVFDRSNWEDECKGKRHLRFFFFPVQASGWWWSETPPPSMVSWCLSSRCNVNGHEPHVSDVIKDEWRRVTRKGKKKKVWRTAPKRGSTSQNYYSIHVQPDLNSLDFSIYSVSIGPSCTKNTVACLTLAHSVIVCTRRAAAQSCFSEMTLCGGDKLACFLFFSQILDLLSPPFSRPLLNVKLPVLVAWWLLDIGMNHRITLLPSCQAPMMQRGCRHTKSSDECQADRSHSFFFFFGEQEIWLCNRYGPAIWRSNRCIWVCIITTRPQLYAN